MLKHPAPFPSSLFVYVHPRPTEWGTGEVESYTDSTANSLIVPGPFRDDPDAPNMLQITAQYVPSQKDYNGFYGVSPISVGLVWTCGTGVDTQPYLFRSIYSIIHSCIELQAVLDTKAGSNIRSWAFDVEGMLIPPPFKGFGKPLALPDPDARHILPHPLRPPLRGSCAARCQHPHLPGVLTGREGRGLWLLDHGLRSRDGAPGSGRLPLHWRHHGVDTGRPIIRRDPTDDGS